jgi:hypothetical protein
MKYLGRIIKLEQKYLPAPSHLISILQYPWSLPDGMDLDTWLRDEVTCSCGAVGCPLMRIGALIPEKASSVEAWGEQVRVWRAQREGSQ